MSDTDTFFADETDWSALKRRTVSGSLYTGLGQAGRVLVNFATQIILTRLLVPEQFGLVAMVLPIVGLIELFGNLGLASAVIQRDRLSRADLNALYWLGLAASLMLAAVLVLVSPLLALMYGEPRVMPIAIALAALLPMAATAGHSSALMARQMKFAALASIDILAAVGALAAVIVAARLHAGYWAIIAGQIMGTGTRAIFDLYFSGWRPSRPRWTTTAWSMLRFGGQVSLFNIINYLSGSIDNVLVGILMGSGPLGLFDRSFALVVRPLASITAPVGKVAVPLLARATGNDVRYRTAFMALAQALLVLVTPGLIVASLLSRDVVLMLLGANWLGITPMFAAISVSAMFLPFSSSSYWIFISQERAGEQVRVAVVSSSILIASMLIGLPWGTVGVAVANAIVSPAVHGVYAWQAGRTGPVRRGDFIRLSLPVAAGMIIGGAFVQLVAARLAEPHWIRLAAGFVAAYAGMSLGISLFADGRGLLCQGVSVIAGQAAGLRRRTRPAEPFENGPAN